MDVATLLAIRFTPRIAAWMLAAAMAPLVQAADAVARPRIGLVLGGGGARGAAHIGVLEVLERLRVPVDCVAGTSMGALVAGAWAAGLTPAAMREELARADWADMFQDNPDYTELNPRNKRLSQRFLPGTESGVTEQGVTAPPGVVSGQKIKLFFNQLVRADIGQRDMAALPLKVSIIATDIGTGARVVFRDGSLSEAMRASMSVPGLMAPYDIGGRKLVDGGLVDNVPIREVRERCQADVVIAVNVGSPLLKPEEVSGLLSVSAQMVAILTEQNVSQSLATLTPNDIYIKPDLDGITAADFTRHAEAADRGRTAAEGAAATLARLSVGAAEFAGWRQRFEDNRPAAPIVDEIQIAGLKRVNPDVVSHHIEQHTGEPLDAELLKRDLLRIYGDGHYERVDYALLTERDRQILRITPIEKRWGPDYLRLGVNLNTSTSQGPGFTLRLGYQKTWLNRLGAEMLLIGEIGSTSGAGIELYQPLDSRQQFFVEAITSYRNERTDVFIDDVRISQYRVERSTVDLMAGINIGLLGQARLGWRDQRSSANIETGIPVLRDESLHSAGLLATLDLDRLNGLYFPSRGWRARGEYFASRDGDFSRLALDGRGAASLGDWVLSARASYTGSTQGTLPVSNAARLGGFLNLSAFATDQLIGDDIRYAHLRAERIVGHLPLGLRGDMRLGMALEAGKVGLPYAEVRFTGWLDSATAYLGGETPFGPVYIGLSRSSQGPTNAYLFLGTP
jgi:NTE family protein